MDRAIAVTRAAGLIYLPTGLFFTGVLAVHRGQMADGTGTAGPWGWAKCAVITATGGAMLVVAQRMRRNGIMAYALAVILSLAVVVAVYAGSIGLIASIHRSMTLDTRLGLALPIRIVGWLFMWWYAYLIYGTCAALPEAWERHRAVRRERLYNRRGFQPIVAGAQVPAVPVASVGTGSARGPLPVAAVATAPLMGDLFPDRRPVGRPALYRTRRMDRAARVTNIAGVIYLSLAAVQAPVWATLVTWNRPPLDAVLTIGVPAAVGSILLTLAWRMRHDDAWAYFAAAATSVVLLTTSCVTFIGIARLFAGLACVGPIVLFGTMAMVVYLMYATTSACGDARDAYRARRRERLHERRGFAPILPVTAAGSPQPSVPTTAVPVRLPPRPVVITPPAP